MKKTKKIKNKKYSANQFTSLDELINKISEGNGVLSHLIKHRIGNEKLSYEEKIITLQTIQKQSGEDKDLAIKMWGERVINECNNFLQHL